MKKKRSKKSRRPAPFKTGAVVRVREGAMSHGRWRDAGAPMTIEECDGDRVICVWFGIDQYARWTGPYRRRFRRGEIELAMTEGRP